MTDHTSVRARYQLRLPSLLHPTRTLLLVALLLVFASLAYSADTLLVVPDGSGDFPTIQAAIDSVLDGDVIELAAGTFTGPGNREIDFLGKAITLRSLGDNPDSCRIDCQGLGRGLTFQNGEDSTTVVQGISVLHGFVTGSESGGGIVCLGASPSFRQCVFAGHESEANGGGLYCENSSPRLIQCSLQGSRAVNGGNLYCTGASQPTLLGCTVVGGNATAKGGGIYSASDSSFIAEQSILWGNCAGEEGEEAYLLTSASSLTFVCSAVDSLGIDGSGTALYLSDNVFTDPMFCGADSCQNAPTSSGDYTLLTTSPCTVENSPCGLLIGAEGPGCSPPAPTGACCSSGGACAIVSEAACINLNGRYEGDSTLCAPNPCPTFLIRADGSGDHPTIQAAINASQDGDLIELASGSFVGPGNQDLQFLGKAIVLRAESGNPDSCQIDCQGSGRGLYFNGGEDSTTVVEGIGILHGNLGGIQRGGGIACVSASPKLTNLIIAGNSSASQGGGVYCEDSSPILTLCTIKGNRAPSGGGLYSKFSSSPVLRSCTVSGNLATSRGGGIFSAADQALALDRTILWGNCATGDGDEAYLFFTTSGLSFACSATQSGGIEGPGGVEYVSDNVFSDPFFCDPGDCLAAPNVGGDYTVRVNSPCLPDFNSCQAQIGAWGSGCGQLPSGACCLNDGNCQVLDEATCLGLEGEYLGEGIPCGPDSCAVAGACCQSDGHCESLTASACAELGGDFLGEGALCDPNPCPPLLVEPDGTGDFPTIQAAIDAAGEGAIVELVSGTYTGAGNKGLEFRGKAITLRAQSGSPDSCLIDCEGSGRGIYFHEGEDAATVVQGITIANGLLTGTSRGAGIAFVSASPTITNCVISGNRTSLYGGGLYCYDASPRLLGCTVAGNQAAQGGGIHASAGAEPSLERTIVWGNCAASDGGEAFCFDPQSRVSFNCSLIDSAGTDGPGTFQYLGENLFLDPLFCQPSPCSDAPTTEGVYGLAPSSLCLAAVSPCSTRIGALGQGCDLASGACCHGSQCALALQETCEDEGGFYLGDSTACTPSPCPEDGACCLPGGQCSVLTSSSCEAQGGQYLGTGVVCPPNGCGSNAGGVLLLHATPGLVFESGNEYCDQSVLEQCGMGTYMVAGADTAVFHVIAAFPFGSTPRLASVSFGIRFDPGKFTLLDSGVCGDLELPEQGWPDSAKGVAVSWNTAQTEQFTEVYWFAGALLDPEVPTVFELIPHPMQGAHFADDSVPSILDTIVCLGSMGFGTAGTMCCMTVSAPEGEKLPTTLQLYSIRPNPAQRNTTITFDLPVEGRTRVSLLSADGRRIRDLLDGRQTPGRHQILWDLRTTEGAPVLSGVYFVRLEAGGRTKVQKAIVLR